MNEKILTLLCSLLLAGPILGEMGYKIAFVSDRDGNQEIYVMNAGLTNGLKRMSFRKGCPWFFDG